MALMVLCDEHNVGYIVADTYPEWWVFPMCPYCRMDWLEEHKDTWDLPVSWKIMFTSTLLAMERCAIKENGA